MSTITNVSATPTQVTPWYQRFKPTNLMPIASALFMLDNLPTSDALLTGLRSPRTSSLPAHDGKAAFLGLMLLFIGVVVGIEYYDRHWGKHAPKPQAGQKI